MPPGSALASTLGDEIVATAEAIRAIFIATIGLLLAFHQIGWDKEQLGSVMLEYQAVSTFLAMIVRSKVTPTKQVALTHRDVTNLQTTAPAAPTG